MAASLSIQWTGKMALFCPSKKARVTCLNARIKEEESELGLHVNLQKMKI